MPPGSKTAASISMALSLAGSVTTAPILNPSRDLTLTTSVESETSVPSTMNSSPATVSPREFSLYKGVSDRPLGWKSRRKAKPPAVGHAARDANLKRWDGISRTTSEWDALRRDPELWYPEGNCLVHLYGHGHSKRGPAFKVPFEDLLNANCHPLIHEFLVEDSDASPVSDGNSSSSGDTADWDQPERARYDLYIPAPPAVERKQAMLHHITTRNLFAWIFKKPMVGPHLGGALVTLLQNMNKFRSEDVENIEDVLEYMDEQGYADMRGQPNHALAILFFAEDFQFRDIWIDAYAHCAGMSELLVDSPEFKHLSYVSRTLIRHGRLEMDMRLDACSKSLGNFLDDELSKSNIGLSASARSHLERFRAFLQAYYVNKFGYYPPSSTNEKTTIFPKHIYERMAMEFQNLYDFLADENFTINDTSPPSAQGGICILQNVQAFDDRYHHDPLPHPLPLLPQAFPDNARLLRQRIGLMGKTDKLKAEERSISLSSLEKASNRRRTDLMKCSFVKAYCAFEKDYLFSNFKIEKASKVSMLDARKVSWIMIYAMLQTLRANTAILDEVRDTQDVSYNLCVRIAGCPPWQEENDSTGILGQYHNEGHNGWNDSSVEEGMSALSSPYPESSDTYGAIKPDIDYFQLTHGSSSKSAASSSPLSVKATGRGILSRSMLGNVPELCHPRPVRNSFHEILVHGYGNGLNPVSIGGSINSAPHSPRNEANNSTDSLPSAGYSDVLFSPTWSDSNGSPVSSVSDFGSHNPDHSESKYGVAAEVPDNHMGVLIKKTSSIYSQADDADLSYLRPQPLNLPEKNVWRDRLRNG